MRCKLNKICCHCPSVFIFWQKSLQKKVLVSWKRKLFRTSTRESSTGLKLSDRLCRYIIRNNNLVFSGRKDDGDYCGNRWFLLILITYSERGLGPYSWCKKLWGRGVQGRRFWEIKPLEINLLNSKKLNKYRRYNRLLSLVGSGTKKTNER